MPAAILIEDHDAVRRALRDWLEVVFSQCRVIEAASETVTKVDTGYKQSYNKC